MTDHANVRGPLANGGRALLLVALFAASAAAVADVKVEKLGDDLWRV